MTSNSRPDTHLQPQRAPLTLTGHPAVQASSATPVAADPELRPPVAPVRPRVEDVHGEVRTDNYAWLRDRDDPESLAYLEAENRYTERAMAHTAPLQERLYQEMLGRIVETDLSVPVWEDGFFYYSRTEAGRQYQIFCRRRASMEAPEDILLDQNLLAEGQPYFRLGALEVSPDHKLLAYSIDTTGAEEYVLHIKDLETGAQLAESIPNTASGVEWANDNRTLFYTVLDAAHRPDRVYRHALGTDASADVLVFHESDESFFVGLGKTKSKRYLIVELGSHTTSEVHYLDANAPLGAFTVVRPRVTGIEYDIAHHDDRLFVVTNDEAENFRLLEAPIGNADLSTWRELIAHDPDVKLDAVEAFRRHLVVYERRAGLQQVRIIELATGNQHHIDFPEPVYTVRRASNPDFESTTLRFVYTSLVTPVSVIDYGMDDRHWELKKRTEVRGGYDPLQYRSERVFATATDGTQIPISLVHRDPFPRDGSRPLLLVGYGAYGSSFDPAFSSNWLSLLDRGFTVAIAHVRGGEELGRRWYHHGKLQRKRNTFTDFIAAAEHLVAGGYTSPDRLAISGGSAGGLLMGAVTNLRPDLFAVVLADVPFVDVVNTMLDPTLPLTVIEYDEWGNPGDRMVYDYLKSYSPYDNVREARYPNMLVTGGLNDPRVAYWEPAKWTAKLRATTLGGTRLLLKTNMGAGHGGASGRYDQLREVAFKYAFMLDVLDHA